MSNQKKQYIKFGLRLQDVVSSLQQDRNVVVGGGNVLPKISVVMPSYNQRDFIERSILSVVNQKYANVEFIIIDGGSQDGTVDVIRKYERYLTFWVSEPDGGQSDALNKGFALATGDIFGWLNSDDVYMPGALTLAAEALSQNLDKLIVYGDWLTIDSSDQLIAREYAFDFNLGQFKYEGFHVNAQAMFWRRDVHVRFGGFDTNLYNTMDYQMIVAFGINEGNRAFLRLPEILGCFRRHENQKTLGFNEKVLNEHRLMAHHYGYMDKYSALGAFKRLLFRFRRAYWYIKRGGVQYFLQKLFA